MRESFKTIYNQVKSLQPRSYGLLLGCLMLSLVFDVKVPLTEQFAYFLGEKKDFTIEFIHVSDLIIVAFILLYAWNWIVRDNKYGNSSKNRKTEATCFLFLISIIVISFSLNFSKLTIPYLSIYYLILLIKFIVLHGTIRASNLEISTKRRVYDTFLLAVLLSSLLGLYQFSMQAPLGLNKIGESKISPYISGIAKIEGLGQVFARSYGSFPHPNIYAAFLLAALLLSYYRLLENKDKHAKLKNLTYFTITTFLGVSLILTFSRAAWLAGASGLLTLTFFTWNRSLNNKKNEILFYISAFLISITISCLILMPLIKHRGNVFDKAYAERRTYNIASVEMIRQFPIFGIGAGASIVEMPRYIQKNAYPSEIQPIHNYYLILTAEYGIPVLILFLIYFALLLKKAKNKEHPTSSLGLSLMVGFGVAMLFDHYFYTIQSSVGLFWIFSALFL